MDLRQALKSRGEATRIARAFGITHCAVLQWADRRVPAERVLRLEELTGIPRHVLRPDIYPAPEAPALKPRADRAHSRAIA